MKWRRTDLNHALTVLLLTAGATALRYLFNPMLGYRSPLLFHILAVAVAAQVAGTASGLITTGLSVVLIGYFFIPPPRLPLPPDPGDALALLLFVSVGASLSFFGGRRKRIADELQRIRYNLETAQHIASIGSWESDLVGKLWWSPETYAILGVEPQPGRPLNINDFYDRVSPEDRSRVEQAVRQAVSTRTDYEVEHRIVRKNDGQVRFIHQQAKVVVNDGTTHLIGSIKDITDKKRGEMAEQILGGLLQVCSACRRIRDASTQQWYSMEGYLRLHSAAKFSHGMCEDCGKQWYSEGWDGKGRNERLS